MKSCTTEARPHRDVATHLLLHLVPRVLPQCRLLELAGRAEPGETRGQTKTGWESTGTGYLHTGYRYRCRCRYRHRVDAETLRQSAMVQVHSAQYRYYGTVSTRFQENITYIFYPVFPPSNL